MLLKDPSIEDSLRREACFVLANPWQAAVGVGPTVANRLITEGALGALVDLVLPSTRYSILKVSTEGCSRRWQAVARASLAALCKGRRERVERQRGSCE